ncbi:lactose/L-arabinose transport system substrate-binding protein [Amycolatopsis bartoniae]|uniref:Sugar transporter n=1 Tax=Amycolatopsis bartoniae TaxID=941986 RepID=A0A8H9IYS1_9PSEU|nr:extracellular solute-binding protein [Amycolatopsis bartoniae]MBB2938489.1 lactose/L-arabinose transport system substrate-binding protein [Amycolatopsis bartoniae]TVT10363.1 extracellular solute-binding protein [Amycolatopsis bartoniae]GHF70652.1 sugar transporter [Amycolatopsis bartoniae]
MKPISRQGGRLLPRRGATLAAAALLVAGLTACGPDIGSGSGSTANGAVLQAPAEDSPKGEITIWDRSGDLFKVFDAAIKKFTEKYPGVTVHHEAVDIDSKLQNTLITGTDVPDGVFLDDAKVGGYVDHLWNLKDVLAPYVKDIAKQKVDVNTVNGGIYGVPFDLDPGLLFYNAKALSAAGIDPNGIKTYDDLLAAAKKYQQYKPGAKPIHLEQDSFNSQLQLEMYASQLGTSLADANGTLRLDSAPYHQILTWLDTVRKEGLGTRAEYLKPSDVGALDSGDEVFYPWAIWFDYAPQQQLTATKGDWRAMPLPAWSAGGARGGAMGGSSFVIPKDSKNPQLAWLFYRFLTFDQAGYTAVYGPNSVYPGGTNTSIPAYGPAADPAKPLFKPIDGMGGQDLWQTAVEAGRQIPGGAPLPVWWSGAVDYLGTDLQKMLDGSMTPQQVIDQASKDIQTNLIERK